MPPSRLDLRALVDCRVTTTLLVASATLSVLYFQHADLGALLPSYPDWKTQPWRLATATLLHANIIHLLFNLYWVARFGVVVESAFGGWRTAGLFLLLALSSSAAELAVFDGGIGLSGIGYGLFGFLWVLNRGDPRFRGTIDAQTTGLFVVWFFFCILATVTNTLPVGNVAHGSGAIVGGLVGWAVVARKDALWLRSTPLVLLLASIAAACTIARPIVKSGKSLARELAIDGYAAIQSEHYQRARELYERAVRYGPDVSSSWWSLGVACWHLEREEDALTAFDRAAALGNLESEQRAFLVQFEVRAAEADYRRSRDDEARKLLHQALLLDPKNVQALNRMAFLCERDGRDAEAVGLYERALDCGPHESWAEKRLSDLKRRAGHSSDSGAPSK